MIELLVPFYVDARPQRRAEIEDSVRMNLANEKFSSVTLFCENADAAAAQALASIRRVVVLPHRALYADLLRHNRSTDVVVIANADVYFDDTIALAEFVVNGQVLCVTRAEMRPFNVGLYWPEAETVVATCHDAWIFRPPLNIPGDFEFGRPGCDHRFAGECKQAGYTLLNPCRHIHVIHNHRSGLRTYEVKTTPREAEIQVGEPHASVEVTHNWPLPARDK